MSPNPAPPAAAAFAPRITRRHHTGGSRFLALLFILIGLYICAFNHWQLGLLVMLLSALVDAKHQTVSTCGKCGNEVANTSTLCPVCSARLSAPEPQALRWFGRIVYAAILIALAIHAWHWASAHPQYFKWLNL